MLRRRSYTAKNTMLLLKKPKGDNLTLLDVYNALMDIEGVQTDVDTYVEQPGNDVVTTSLSERGIWQKQRQAAINLL